MTTRPELKLGRHLLPGLVAVALFVVLAAVTLATPFGAVEGFPAGQSITARIGYAMFDLPPAAADPIPSENFLVAFEIIDVVLVAALVAAVMLARRDVGGRGRVRTALGTGDGDDAGAGTGTGTGAGTGTDDANPGER